MKSKSCVGVSKSDLQTFNKALNKLKLNIADLKESELMTILSELQTSGKLPTAFRMKDIVEDDELVRLINNKVGYYRDQAKQKAKKAEKAPVISGKLGNLDIEFDTNRKKADPELNKSTMYVISGNLQAFNKVYPESRVAVNGLIMPKEGATIDIHSGPAMNITDRNGDVNPNAFVFVFRKNAQDKDGNWIGREQQDDALFKESELDEFMAANNTIIEAIRKHMLEGKEFTSINIPRYLGVDMLGNKKEKKMAAYLPEKLAKALQEKLALPYEKGGLRILTQLIRSDLDENLWGLEVQLGEQKKKEKSTKAKEAMESLQAQRPVNITLNTQRLQANVLKRSFPNIAERRARVNLISSMFTRQLDKEIDIKLKELESIVEAGIPMSDDDFDTYNILTKGSERDKRRELLSLKYRYEENGVEKEMPMSFKILNDIKDLINMIGSLCGSGNSIPMESVNAVINTVIKNPNNVFGAEYALESQTSTVTQETLEKRAAKIIEFCAKVAYTPNLFDALVDSASESIANEENVKLSIDKSRVILNPEEVEEATEDDEATENRAELHLVKQKLIDPKTSLSYRIKSRLSHAYKVDHVIKEPNGEKRIIYAYNDLGMRIKLNSGVAYYDIMKRFANINSPEEFLMGPRPLIDRLEDEYPWFTEMADEIRRDPDFANEVYRCFRQVLQVFGVITKDGNIQFKNMGLDASALLDIVAKNYEGCNVLTETSLYDNEGGIDMESVKMFRKLLFKEKKESTAAVLTKHPLAYAHSMLASKSPLFNIEDGTAENTHKILRGEFGLNLMGEAKYDTSISNLLMSLGIDTTDIQLNVLLPDINWEQINTMDDLNEVWSKDSRDKLFTILDAMQKIVKEKTGLTANSNLLNDFRGSLLRISGCLTGIAENYTQSSFYLDGKSRFSYTHPDAISKIVGIISTRTQEEVRDYLEENYTMYDFFKNSPLIHTFMEDEDVRKKFFRCQILEVQTGGDSAFNTIGNVTKKNLLTGLICAHYSANSVLSKNSSEVKHFGWYHNPLYSDTEALDLFRLPRFTGAGWEDKVIDNIVTVAEAEVDRIVANMADWEDSIKVDNYNSGKNNAGKFNFLPALNSEYVVITIDKDKVWSPSKSMSYQEAKQLQEQLSADKRNSENSYIIRNKIINDLDELRRDSNDLYEYGVEKRKYLKEVITNMMNDEFMSFMEEVDKLGIEKLTLFKNIRKSLNKQSSNNSESFQEQDVDFSEEENNEEETQKTDTSGLTAEEKIAEVDEYLKEFYYNDFYAQSQLIMLLGGDLAYYKNIRDFIKRNKQCYASGEKLYSIEDGKPMMETAVYLKDKYVVSNSYDSIKELLKSAKNLSKYEKEIIKGSLDSFIGKKGNDGICSTDGQAFRTPKSFKRIYKAMGGIWTDAIENSFNNIINGDVNVEDFSALVNAIKPFMFTYEERIVNGRIEKIPVQHKNSEYMLSALLSTLNTALNQSPELKALQKFCELHNIDTIQFSSCVKNGGFNPIDLNYAYASFGEFSSINEASAAFNSWLGKLKKSLINGDITQEEYNKSIGDYGFIDDNSDNELEGIIRNEAKYSQEEYKEKLQNFQRKHPRNALVQLELHMLEMSKENTLHVLPMEDYMIAQPNADHLTGAKALIGSQGRNIIPADLSESFITRFKLGGYYTTMNRSMIRQLYDTLFTDRILSGHSKLQNEFSDIKEVRETLLSLMEGNPKYSDEIKKAFELDEKEEQFVVPANSPIINNKSQDLILSQFKNNIQKLYINGGNVVLVSNFGLSHGFRDELHVHYKYVKDENGEVQKAVDYIPCYLPASEKTMYQDYLIEETDDKGLSMYYLDVDKMKKDGVDEDLFNMIGYRIPTEDKYSMMPLRVVGFMPIQAGATIMLPSDIISMSGTDFDIDKLFLMRKSFRREIAPEDLGLTFSDWADSKGITPNEKLLEKLTYVKRNENNEIEEISERNLGFTAQEIASLYKKYPEFRQFMEEVECLYEKPKYKVQQPKIKTDSSGVIDIDATSKMEGIKNEELKNMLRNNMLIDVYWGILTSLEGSRQMMTPASYKNVTMSARREIIENNPVLLRAFQTKYADAIKKYGTIYNTLNHFAEIAGVENTAASIADALDEFIDEFSAEDEPCDIVFYLNSHRNLMDGNGLIGGFAVNSSRHYKFQLYEKEGDDKKKHAGITINENNQFRIKIPGYVGEQSDGSFLIKEVDPRISPITKSPIGRICSEFQAASPDNGKDPQLGFMGVSMRTLKQTCFMTSIGLPIEVIGFLNNANDILAIGNHALGNARKKAQQRRKLKLSDYTLDIAVLDDIAVRYRLEGKEGLNGTDITNLKNFALWWENLKDCAKDLGMASVFVRADSPNGALEVMSSDALIQLMQIEALKKKIRNGKCAISGLNEVIDFDLMQGDMTDDEFRDKILSKPIPRLQAFFSCGIRNATKLVEKYLPELSTTALNEVINLGFQAGIDLTDDKYLPTLRAYLNELTTYMLSSASFLHTDDLETERNFYIHDFPMKYKAFLDEKDSNHHYKHNDVRNLTIIKMLTNVSGKGIKFRNVGGKVSQDSRKYYTEGLDQLIMDEDPEVQQFAADMFKYAYYEHGLLFGNSNYGIFFSMDFTEAFDGFNESLKEGNERIRSGDKTFLTNYTLQHLLNHSNLIKLGPAENKITFRDNEAIIELASLDDEEQNRIRGENDATGQIEYRKLIKLTRDSINSKNETTTVTEVYRLKENETTQTRAVYEKIGHNKKGNSPFYDNRKSIDAIDWNGLKGKGAVISSKVQEKIAEAMNKDNINDPQDKAKKAPTELSEPGQSKAADEKATVDKIDRSGNLFSSSDTTATDERVIAAANSFNEQNSQSPEVMDANRFTYYYRESPIQTIEELPDTEKMCVNITLVNFSKGFKK